MHRVTYFGDRIRAVSFSWQDCSSSTFLLLYHRDPLPEFLDFRIVGIMSICLNPNSYENYLFETFYKFTSSPSCWLILWYYHQSFTSSPCRLQILWYYPQAFQIEGLQALSFIYLVIFFIVFFSFSSNCSQCPYNPSFYEL